jgi:hypothetical protein
MSIFVPKTLPYLPINSPARWICLHFYHCLRWLVRCSLSYATRLLSLRRFVVTVVFGWEREGETDAAYGDGCLGDPLWSVMSGPTGIAGTARNMRFRLGVQNEERRDGKTFTLILDAKVGQDALPDYWPYSDQEALNFCHSRADYVPHLAVSCCSTMCCFHS